nr:transposase family protein [Cellulomonas sp. KRMCY2]
MFVEQHPTLVAPRGSLSCRAVTWAITQLRHEHATVAGLARQLGTSWKTVWRAVRPRSVELADDESRLERGRLGWGTLQDGDEPHCSMSGTGVGSSAPRDRGGF